jgi:adenine phosphoribosyltransferase
MEKMDESPSMKSEGLVRKQRLNSSLIEQTVDCQKPSITQEPTNNPSPFPTTRLAYRDISCQVNHVDSWKIDRLRDAIREIPDFPKPGILFKDLTPVLSDGALFRDAVACFLEANRALRPDCIAGIDARGFLFGSVVAYELGVGFVPVRKKGKLPYRCRSISYQLEYGEASVEIHEDAFERGAGVVLIDDLLATGGTAAAASQLITSLGAKIIEVQFFIELTSLNGAKSLDGIPHRSFLKF